MVREIERAVDVTHEAVNAAAMHARRIVGIVSTAAGRLAREVGDLVWDYQDMASAARRPVRDEMSLRDVGVIDLFPPNVDSVHRRRDNRR
ncbi:MAG: hypothetical protein JWR37_2759 [Mycobacterium sp.]|jgi:hypothetical protein|nr:hypothetical protein [Mycobacterium sp.]